MSKKLDLKINSKLTISVTSRLNADFVSEIDEIAHSSYSNRTKILQACLELGMEVFKKQNPDIMERVRKRKHNEDKKGAHKKSA